MEGVRTVLTSVSASKVRSSCKLSLMRARLFFSTRGFRVCRDTKITLHHILETHCGGYGHRCSGQTAAGATSASLPSAPRGSVLPPHQPRCGYLSVRFLNPVVGLIFLHIKHDVAGPSRRGHVGWIAASVASPSAAFSSRVVSKRGQLANGTGFREKKSTDSPCVYCTALVRRAAGAEWLLLVFIRAY